MTKLKLLNYINGEWRASTASEYLDVMNPATAVALAQVPLSPATEVDQAARAATEAFLKWGQVPSRSGSCLMLSPAVIPSLLNLQSVRR